MFQFAAEYANLPFIPPSLQPMGDFSYGANFASSGAAVWILMALVACMYFGGNDYHNYYENFYDKDSSLTPSEQEQFVKYIVGNTIDALIELYELGARKIAFQNVGPMGRLPECKTQFSKFNGSCIPDLLSMPTLNNKELITTLTDLAERLEGFKFSIFDYLIALMDRIENPSEYGKSITGLLFR
ncbi:hypothetical protein CRG98_043093 [Punica granatum]|uniref:Uncharacterized protein n=1 Tax=Punica granatum TaxID=22663 RepID=A0A2I0HZ31_PUNGR|nr:hypothetical protein CRG98_043093 [Punica granatum]